MNQDPLSLGDFLDSDLAEDIEGGVDQVVEYHKYLKEFYEATIDLLEMTNLDGLEDIYESPAVIKVGWILVTLAAHVIVYLSLSGIIFR